MANCSLAVLNDCQIPPHTTQGFGGGKGMILGCVISMLPPMRGRMTSKDRNEQPFLLKMDNPDKRDENSVFPWAR